MSINQIVRDKILEILQDQQWHELGELLNVIGKCITSEKASQIYITYQNSDQRSRPRPLEEQIQMGKRWVIMAQCRKLHKSGQINQEGIGFTRTFKIVEPKKELPIVQELRAQLKKMEEILSRYEGSK